MIVLMWRSGEDVTMHSRRCLDRRNRRRCNSFPMCCSLLCLPVMQALLDEAVELLSRLEQLGALALQPERLQRKHASLAQFVSMLQQPNGAA